MCKFPDSHKLWNWLVMSSTNPQAVSLFAKGLMIQILPQAMMFLPMIGIQLSADFQSLPDIVYGVVYYGLNIISSVMMLLGGLRKIWNTFILSKVV